MNIIQEVKKAPRWVWITTGGLSIGIIGIKLWKGRAAGPSGASTTDASTVGEAGSTQPVTTGSPAGQVLVPPIIMGSQQDSGATDAALTLVGGLVDDLTGLFGNVVSGDQATMQELVANQGSISEAAIGLLAGGGSHPTAPSTTVVVTPAPAPARGPRARPQAPVKSVCPSDFPRHNGAEGPPSPKSCYRCEKNPRSWKYPVTHRYQNGHSVQVGSC